MNKRFKLSGFDERIIRYRQDIINSGNQFFQVNIRAVGKNADAVVVRWNHEDDRPEAAIGTCMVDGFGSSSPLADEPAAAIPKILSCVDFCLALPGFPDHRGIGKQA